MTEMHRSKIETFQPARDGASSNAEPNGILELGRRLPLPCHSAFIAEGCVAEEVYNCNQVEREKGGRVR